MPTTKTEVLTALEINGETGEVIVRPFTEEELANQKAAAAQFVAQLAAQEAKAAARASALAKLAELGLTEEEIAAL